MEWVDNPPQPLSDLRRADLHRITFVGKGTKKMHERHWKDMPATAKTSMQSVVEKMTASSFRSRVKELQQKQHCKKRETEPQRGS